MIEEGFMQLVEKYSMFSIPFFILLVGGMIGRFSMTGLVSSG